MSFLTIWVKKLKWRKLRQNLLNGPQAAANRNSPCTGLRTVGKLSQTYR
jgi:hypothetical protein